MEAAKLLLCAQNCLVSQRFTEEQFSKIKTLILTKKAQASSLLPFSENEEEFAKQAISLLSNPSATSLHILNPQKTPIKSSSVSSTPKSMSFASSTSSSPLRSSFPASLLSSTSHSQQQQSKHRSASISPTRKPLHHFSSSLTPSRNSSNSSNSSSNSKPRTLSPKKPITSPPSAIVNKQADELLAIKRSRQQASPNK